MKNFRIIMFAFLLSSILVGIGYALTPPPPPPPPVGQNIGLFDIGIDNQQTNATDQIMCRYCHQTSGTNISGGYSNAVGGVPTRHHSLMPRGVINPLTNATFGCTDCHPSTPGLGNGIVIDRSCVNCHNGTAFWGNSLGGHIGNFTRPHHVNTAYASSNIGQPAQNRTCNFCHGSFVDNYNDGHYKPSYATDFMITPFATFKTTNFSQPDGLGGNKTWGGCESCHLPSSAPHGSIKIKCYWIYFWGIPFLKCEITIEFNFATHHKEIMGLADFNGTTAYQNASTPGASCSWCHVMEPDSNSPLRINITNPFNGENLINAMEVRNSTIENVDVFEPGTTNITINGTGCEKCHSVKSLHNIQFNYSQNGQQGLGHINNNTDCYGCHNSWLPATDFVPGPLVPDLEAVTPSVIAAGTATTLTLTGFNFVSGGMNYAVAVTVDGVTYTPTTSSDTELVVDIPALNAGTHQLQIVKDGSVLSKLYTLIAAPNLNITSARLSGSYVTITGFGFGNKPAPNANYYISADHNGNQIISRSISSWSNTQIRARFNSGTVSVGDTVTVVTGSSGEARSTITN